MWGAESRLAVEGAALDLTKRYGLLAAMEHCVRKEANRAGEAAGMATVLVGAGHSIAPTARILGPVVVDPDVCIGEHATVVGPALIGAGAQISSGAGRRACHRRSALARPAGPHAARLRVVQRSRRPKS